MDSEAPDTPPKNIRHVKESDHLTLVAAWEEWPEHRLRRPASALLQKLFVVHFADTSFVVEQEDGLIACLIGFLSQTRKDEAYVHFIGVKPDCRRTGLARSLYERFFEVCRANGRTVVRGVTSPANRGSIAFHQRLGFILAPSEHELDGIPIHRDYDGPGIDMALLRKEL
jgi:ribosomal protein S18 acetylase RimI-like enzyme